MREPTIEEVERIIEDALADSLEVVSADKTRTLEDALENYPQRLRDQRKEEEEMTKRITDTNALLIMACPYCGSPDVHEVNRVEGHMVESVAVECLTCDEGCVIDRRLEDEDDDA